MLLRLLKTSSFKPAASSRRPPLVLVLAIRSDVSLNRPEVAVELTRAAACLSMSCAAIVAARFVVLECRRVLIRDTVVGSAPAGRDVPAISIWVRLINSRMLETRRFISFIVLHFGLSRRVLKLGLETSWF